MTNRHLFSAATATAAALLATTTTTPVRATDDHKIVSAQEIKWGPAPPSIPTGAQAAVLYGEDR